jgi:hypothetical protein
MSRQDIKSALVLAALAGAAVACAGGAHVTARAEPSVPPPVAGACYATADCTDQQFCVDPRYPQCGAIPACEEPGLIRCGCTCVVAGAAVCALDEVRGASGCCEPRPCTADAGCGGLAGSRCLAGRCVRRGTCELPAP